MKLANHPVHGVGLAIYQLVNCVNSFCLCLKMTVPVYKILHVKGPSQSLVMKMRKTLLYFKFQEFKFHKKEFERVKYQLFLHVLNVLWTFSR